MRAAAEVNEIALAIQRHFLIGRNRGNDFCLVVLANRFEKFHRLVARPRFARNRNVALGQLRHALFNRGKIFRRERALIRKVVVEAIFDHGSDRHLRVGKQFLHCIGQQMRGGMPDQIDALGVLVRDDREIAVGLD